ncbi:MAG: hypothetical protein AB1571_03950 [Nanoarchaeota archaeon]
MKKGDITWDEIAKLIIALTVLIFLVIAVWLLKDKIVDLFDKFLAVLRFG